MILISMVLFIYIGIWEMQYFFGSGNKYEDKINEHWHFIEEIGKKETKKPTWIYDTQALFVMNNILKQNPTETFIHVN